MKTYLHHNKKAERLKATMKYKLDKKFFDTHKVPQLSAANIFLFSENDAVPDLLRHFEKIAKEKGIAMPDGSDERTFIMSMTDPETIVDYMRKFKSIENRNEMIQKVSEYEEEAMPLVLKRYLTSALDNFIETAGHCFAKNDIKYTINLREKYNEIRNPYAKAVACLVFGIKGMDAECDFLFEEYEKMCKSYPKESFSDYPLLALHILFEK